MIAKRIEWREMPKEPRMEDFNLAVDFVLAYAKWRVDLADALRERLRDVAKVLEDSQRLHTGFCQTGWKEDKRACSCCDALEAIPTILARLKSEGII